MATHQPTHNQPENWKPVVGYEGLYEVSDQGRVKSLARHTTMKDGRGKTIREKILKNRTLPSGHKYVSLSGHGSKQKALTHRLVMLAFVGPCPEGMEVCHNDGNPENNHLSNLRYGTRSDNVQDMIRHKTHWCTRKTHCKRGHLLESPNLVPSTLKRGRRACLACDRAKRYVYNHKELEPHLQSIADSYYEKILEGIPPDAHTTTTQEECSD